MYQIVASPDVFKNHPTKNPPWPGNKGDLEGLQGQGVAEFLFFEEGATIHFDKITPLPSWTSLVLPFSNNELSRTSFVVSRLGQLSSVASRRLTAREIDITSDFAAASFRWYPWTSAATFASSIALTWSGMRTFKFPFYTPRIDPLVFPREGFAFFRGRQAMLAWHSFRFLVYATLLSLPMKPLGVSLASTSFSAHVVTDPRLSDLRDDIKKAVLAQRAAANNSQRGPGADRSRSPQGLPPPQTRRIQTQYPPESENRVPPDYTPDTYNDQSENSSGESTMNPTPRDSWPRNNQPPASPNNTQDTRFPDSSSGSVNVDSDPFDDDDASPVPASVRKAEEQRARNAQGGSAWDRLRQQSQSGNSPKQEGGWAKLRQGKTQSDDQPKTEGFAYTKQDEEKEKRNYEKEQAQKEFDALLEAERRGQSNRR
ncbi:hypothetical protein F4781DRAFT_92898 [Annulohypoxylon bovei var. microspora]|nr:hypothetical protein F4781DRAFT_92898 [Annulohypoxylon bovei var. microspora]